MTTPDETPDEALDQLCEAAMMWEGRLEAPADFPGSLDEALAPIVAKIRRQAATDALLDAARSLESTGASMRKQARAYGGGCETASAIAYNNQADAFYRSATKLRTAAADKIAEGYEFECAAFSQECDQRVPDAGDYCSKHEPEDDEDRWAE